MGLAEAFVGIASIVGGFKMLHDSTRESSNKSKIQIQGLDQLVKSIPGPTARIHEVSTIDERVGHIAKMVSKSKTDPKVRQLASQIVAQRCGNNWCVAEKDWLGEVKAIFDYVRRNVRYTRDVHGIDTFQHANRTVEFQAGDCDDYTILLSSLLATIGYPCALVVIRTVGSPDWNHIYMKVGLPPRNPEKWMTLDGSVSKPAGWEVPKSMVAESKLYLLK